WSVLLPVIAGVAITVGASLVPMRSATRVAPLHALRPEPPAHHQGLGVRGVLGVLAILTGIAALVGGTALPLAEITGLGILLAMAGRVISCSGGLLTLAVLPSPLSAGVGSVSRRLGGLPSRIASASVARKPRRSAATIAAMLIGTTLMTMMAVGARIAEPTLT